MSTTVHLEVFTSLVDSRDPETGKPKKHWCKLAQSALREQLTLLQSGGDKQVVESSLLLGVNAHLKPRRADGGVIEDWFMDQNYFLFSHLAGVCNGARGPRVEKPIFELNGYPEWHPAYVGDDCYPNDPAEYRGVGEVGFCTPREFLDHPWPSDEPLEEHFGYHVERGMFVWAQALLDVFGPDGAVFVFSFSM